MKDYLKSRDAGTIANLQRTCDRLTQQLNEAVEVAHRNTKAALDLYATQVIRVRELEAELATAKVLVNIEQFPCKRGGRCSVGAHKKCNCPFYVNAVGAWDGI